MTRTADIDAVRREGKRFRTRHLEVRYVASLSRFPRVGIIVPKHKHGAVDRNQIPFSERGSRLLLFQDDDHLQIKLAERWFKIDQQLSSYRQRPPILDEWRFTDEHGTPLDLEITTYPHRIDCHSRLDTFSIVFADTESLLITLPAGRCGLTFQAHLIRRIPIGAAACCV